MREINSIVVHTSDSPWGDAAVIRDWHKARGFRDIGYHAVILNGFRWNSTDFNADVDGLLEPGRPVSVAGAHVKGHNRGTLGICLIGKAEFTPNQFNSLERLLWAWRGLYLIPREAIIGHCDLDPKKTCPNFDVQEAIKTMRL